MKATDSQLRFVVNIDSNIPNELFGDETRIRQVLINVLGNAIKYTDEGFVMFTVTREDIDEHSINLIVDVTDSGRGIKEEDIGDLFSDYVQVDTASNRGIEGAGLGLAISKKLLSLMNGDIHVFSEYGKGSTFTITLPQTFRSDGKLVSVENPDEKSVIVFERRDIYANSIVCTLGNLGVRCDSASSETEFARKLACKDYSHIFIAPKLYDENRDAILELGVSSKTVLLTEFGEVVPDTSLSILAMPVHSISVANVLNGIAEVYAYKESDGSFVGFTAPDALILVVDDIKTNLTVVEGLLLPYDMQVDLRKSGMEAIRAVQANHYDLIFMDHWMPEMDGVEAARRIRELGDRDPYYKTVPIIALTANAITGTQDMFLKNGFDGFLAKPIDMVKLNAMLEKWIPREKQKKPMLSGDRAAEKKGLDSSMEAFEIKGVDINKGIALTGGSIERYLETIAVFYEDGVEKKKELKTCIETGNIHLYTIVVHALKSAAANIGADDLSNTAKNLETAGRQGDLGFIETHNAEFLTELESLLGILCHHLSASGGNEEAKNNPADMAILKIKLEELKKSLVSLDAGATNSTLDDLLRLKLPKDTASAIQSISMNILIAEYNEALALIETLLQKGNNGTGAR
jgi:CheY-like chemotaxis protein/HPt (histidine-containing phosphotransfer) domain-containing protein